MMSMTFHPTVIKRMRKIWMSGGMPGNLEKCVTIIEIQCIFMAMLFRQASQ